MNKWVLRLASLMIMVGLLAGCGSDDGNDEKATSDNNQTEQQSGDEATGEKNEDTVVITISKDKESGYIDEKEIPIEDGAILMDVMEENFAIEADFDGGFITSIEGVAPKQDEQKAWMFFVDGELATKGVKDYELSPGDKISFDLQAWE